MQNDSTAPDSFGLFSTLFHAFVVLVDTLRFGKNRKRSAWRISAKDVSVCSNLNIRPEEPHIDGQQLSFSDADEREPSVLRR